MKIRFLLLAFCLFFSSILNAQNSNEAEFTYVRLGNIDVLSSDLGELTYDDAKNAIKNLGEGWRLPNEKELILMFNNQDKIGTLSRRQYSVVQDYWIYAGNYLGEESTGELVLLRTLIDPGYTISFNKSNVQKRTYTYIRPVRDVPSNPIAKSSNQTKSSKNKSSATKAKSNSKGKASELNDVMPLISEAYKINARKAAIKTRSFKCKWCEPANPKGHEIHDYDSNTGESINYRYVLRPGYKICDICSGTGKSNRRGENTPCMFCDGKRFKVCDMCDGTGKTTTEEGFKY